VSARLRGSLESWNQPCFNVSAHSNRGPGTGKSGTTIGFSFGIVFDMVALELDKLVKAKLAQCLALSRIFPSDPSKVLHEMNQYEATQLLS
jgi:hypothetical protein